MKHLTAPPLPEHCSTREVAQALGLAVRSVQLMVDRGELQAWKTPGGHRRLVRLVLGHDFPQVDLHVADDGIIGLAMAGQLQPDLLLVDILLPGIDGATLIARLRSHPQFQHSRLIVVTSLDEVQRAPYAFALADLPVVHKPRLVQELPLRLKQALALA